MDNYCPSAAYIARLKASMQRIFPEAEISWEEEKGNLSLYYYRKDDARAATTNYEYAHLLVDFSCACGEEEDGADGDGDHQQHHHGFTMIYARPEQVFLPTILNYNKHTGTHPGFFGGWDRTLEEEFQDNRGNSLDWDFTFPTDKKRIAEMACCLAHIAAHRLLDTPPPPLCLDGIVD